MKAQNADSEKAFSELYYRFSDRIFNYCYKILGNYQDAKDIFQETFIQFYQNIDSFELTGSVSGLLFIIARNTSINFNRSHKLFSELNEEFFVQPELDQDQKETMDLIGRALELIPFAQKEAFILRHYQGLNYEEISRIMMIDQATIRNRVKRAIASIQKLLKPHFDNVKSDFSDGKKKKKELTNYLENKIEI
jgi:RNA polymerase sigma-70 factor (ECF subfamily)